MSLQTGVHRKDVKRLRSLPSAHADLPRNVSLGAQLISRWVGQAPWLDADERGRYERQEGDADPDHPELRYSQVVLVGLALCREQRRFLVVGLGGGALPTFLHRQYPKAAVDAVDIDPAVVEVARRYFGFRDDALLNAYAPDGREFIESTRAPYDAIFLDAFGTDSVPPQLTTVEFLRAVRRAVKPDGVVVGNRSWMARISGPNCAIFRPLAML